MSLALYISGISHGPNYIVVRTIFDIYLCDVQWQLIYLFIFKTFLILGKRLVYT